MKKLEPLKLSDLKKQVDDLSLKAKKQKVDPEIRIATLPNFPMGCTIRPELVSTVGGDFSSESVGGIHVIYLAELQEVGYLEGNVSEALDWR